MKVRQASNAKDYKTYDTARLREEFLIEDVFGLDKINLTYSEIDRIIVGGVVPVKKEVVLESSPELRAEHFLDRREMGVMNIGGPGKVIVDGISYEMEKYDCLYVAMGSKKITFISADQSHPAKFYFNSVPSHAVHPTTLVHQKDAKARHLGSKSECNERTINRYILPGGVESSQLVMGFTHLEDGSIWNTMPCHTHDRRMEVYLYFDMSETDAVIHLMGPKDETRHLIVKNEQAIISPSWSIHSGAGTRNYTFIWGMCGENMDFDDMDNLVVTDLK